MRKTMRVALEPKRARVVVVHEITNDTCWPLRVAPWAITIVDQAGTAVLPQPPFHAHADSFLPARPLVQWAYTDLSDPRWHIGRRLVSLTPDAGRPDPQKIGAANHAGWCAVVYPDLTFVKQAPWIDSVEYPDMGCSTELFTAGDYLEVETLAPLSWLEPGETATHTETWTIAAGIDSDLRDAPLEAAIAAAIAADATP
jgi:hypothetical protein